MSSIANHKKMFHILREAKKNKGLLLAVMFQTMEDDPGKVANAYEKVFNRKIHGTSGVSPGYGPWVAHKNDLWQCPDCKKFVSKLGIAGACITCDPKGFDVPY